MCCQRSTERPNRHKSIRVEMKRAKAWCVCPLSCQGCLMGAKQHFRRRWRTDQASGEVKIETKTLVTCVPDRKGHTGGSQFNQPFNPASLSSDRGHEAGSLNPVVHQWTQFKHRDASTRTDQRKSFPENLITQHFIFLLPLSLPVGIVK